MPKRTANARWEGSLQDGKGTMRMASGAYEGPYSFQSRFEEGDGTNPEELIAAAHAGCFSMALSGELGRAGHEVDSVETEATVHLDKVEDGLRHQANRAAHPRERARRGRLRLPGGRRGRQEGLPGIPGAGGGGVDRGRRAADVNDGIEGIDPAAGGGRFTWRYAQEKRPTQVLHRCLSSPSSHKHGYRACIAAASRIAILDVVRAVLVIAALAAACAFVLLATAGGDPRSSAAAQLPATAVTAPPPGHHADPSLKTYVFRVGPFSIGGYQTFRHNDLVKPPPVPGSIVGMDVRVVDTQGGEIPQSQLMLHHNVFTNGGPDNRRNDGACPHRSVTERFYGTSEELRPLTLPRGYGYPTDPQDKWKMIWMVMNHRHERREAYVEYRVTVDPAKLTPVTPYWLSVVPCVSDPQYTVPGGGRPGSVHRSRPTPPGPEGSNGQASLRCAAASRGPRGACPRFP